MQKELDVLKQQKKDAKKQIGLVDMAIKENLYTAYHDVPEIGELIEDNELVIPQMEEAVACKGLTDEVDTVEVERADVGVSVVDTIHREKKQEKDASEDVCVDALEYVEKARDGETTIDVPVQKYCGADLKESYENNTEDMFRSKSEPAMDMEEVVAETNVKDKSFYSYADYHVSTDEEKVRVVGVNGNDDVLAVYEKLNSFFKQIGHEADFDRLYEESKRLVDVVKKNVVADKAEKVARELLACGPYKYLKTSVKANAFKFNVSDASGNLKLFMSVLDKLGVKLDGNQLYEEYQKIYEETVSKNDVHEKEQEKQWNIGRGR